MRLLFATVLLLWSSLAVAGQPGLSADNEIQHLLSYLESSNCQFYRNGSWHSAADAKAHLHKKYDYLLKKDLVPNTEAFIKRAASESSMSGKPYLVKCGTGKPVESATWFSNELKRYRH